MIINALKMSIVRYLNPQTTGLWSQKLTRILLKSLILKTKYPVKIRDIHKIEKKNSISISDFGYENKKKRPIYVSKKCCEEKHIVLLLIGEERKRHYAFIKDLNTFMYDHFCRYCLQFFSPEEILKRHIKDHFEINGKQIITMPKKERVLNSIIMRER